MCIAGGGMQASATDASRADMGEKMILGGLFVQILFFSIFIIVSIIFHRRMLSTPLNYIGTELPWSRYLKILYAVSTLIMVRSVFRVAEYVQGKGGFLQSKEVFIYIFDGALMLVCCGVLNVWHPSGIVDGRKDSYKPAEDLEMLRGGAHTAY